jgi:hypothetical protein
MTPAPDANETLRPLIEAMREGLRRVGPEIEAPGVDTSAFMARAIAKAKSSEPTKSIISGAQTLAEALPGWWREAKEDPWGAVGGTLIEAGRAQLGLPPRTPEYAKASSFDRTAADLDYVATNPEVGASMGQLAMPMRVAGPLHMVDLPDKRVITRPDGIELTAIKDMVDGGYAVEAYKLPEYRKVGIAEFVETPTRPPEGMEHLGLDWASGPLKAWHVKVADDLQRQDIASQMYDLAEATYGRPILNGDIQTPAGEAFRNARRNPGR